jgi:ABC-type amino acid transport system permease subunit
LAITLYETFTGFFIGSIFGIGLGFVLGRREILAEILDPYVVAFNGIPRIALAPLFIIWFGIGTISKVILVVSVVFFLTFFNTFAGGRADELKNILRIGRQRAADLDGHATGDRAVDHHGLKSVSHAIVAAVVENSSPPAKGWAI